MKTLNVNVADKTATYQTRDGVIICGNSDYQIQFAFDEEWDSHDQKTARFEWNGQYHDVEFTGNVCQVPVIQNTPKVYVGVYVGEMPEDTLILSTTRCEIPCGLSVRCGGAKADDGTGKNYTNEAKGAAAEAKAAAEQAQTAMENIEQYKGLELICSLVTSYEYPTWTQRADCYTAPITAEEYELYKSAMIVKAYLHDYTDYPNVNETRFVKLGEVSEYGEIGDSGDELYIATEQYTENHHLCVTNSFYEKYIKYHIANGPGPSLTYEFYR